MQLLRLWSLKRSLLFCLGKITKVLSGKDPAHIKFWLKNWNSIRDFCSYKSYGICVANIQSTSQTGSLFRQCHPHGTVFGSMKDTKVKRSWFFIICFKELLRLGNIWQGKNSQEKSLRGNWLKLWWWRLGCDKKYKKSTILKMAEFWDISQAQLHTSNGYG